MSLTFYTAPMSTATITELVLAELAVPFERVQVDIRKGETKGAAFRAINPNGKVPAIAHDGTVIWEAAAITMYLGEVFGVERGLYPSPGPRRGEAMKWIVWTAVTLAESVHRYARNAFDWVPAEQRNIRAAEVGKQDVAENLAILDRALEGRSFLAGDFTLADSHVNSFLDWLRYMKMDLSPYASIAAWNQRCVARPAYGRVMGAQAG